MRYRALVEYDGTNYYGFQRQRDDQPTIQAELEIAIGHLASRPVVVTGSGRTDSGVHALGQVVSFDFEWQHSPDALLRAINANLPDDVALIAVEETSPGFHPRYDAISRVYEYHVYNSTTRRPLRRLRSWHVPKSLDVGRMNQAAGILLGSHDFATFGNAPQGSNTVREVFAADWKWRGELLVFSVGANAFLYHMVRSLVSSLCAVGDGSWTKHDFEKAFRARDRSQARSLAPPYGLYLVRVVY